MAGHHDLCFGCGQANVFGLHLEDGRFFVKQDHQGPDGRAHPAVVAAALLEAIMLAAGASEPPARLEVSFETMPAVGTFVSLSAQPDAAEAVDDTGARVASAKAAFRV
jgi:hypothetical protein